MGTRDVVASFTLGGRNVLWYGMSLISIIDNDVDYGLARGCGRHNTMSTLGDDRFTRHVVYIVLSTDYLYIPRK